MRLQQGEQLHIGPGEIIVMALVGGFWLALIAGGTIAWLRRKHRESRQWLALPVKPEESPLPDPGPTGGKGSHPD